jgi:glycosyltransferase involved in cell wall biosynthesis
MGVLASPLLMKMYGLRAMLRGMSIPDLWRWMYRRKYLIGHLDQADYVVFPSKAIAEIVASRLSHRRWRVVPNGLTPVWFENPRATRSAASEPASLTLGFSGSLAEHKAPHLLLEAVRLLGWTKTRVRVAGNVADTAYEGRLRSAAEGLSVEFVGGLPAKQMPAFLRSLDILAMTSIWPENCPYAVLEAQAAGIGVVGSRAGGVVELIGDERLLFEPGSARGLAAAIDFARCNPGAGRSARVATAQEMTDTVAGIYEQAIQREGKSGSRPEH